MGGKVECLLLPSCKTLRAGGRRIVPPLLPAPLQPLHPCPALWPACRLEHVSQSIGAAQKAAAKDVSAAAISLLEAPPADLWPRLSKVGAVLQPTVAADWSLCIA